MTTAALTILGWKGVKLEEGSSGNHFAPKPANSRQRLTSVPHICAVV